MTAVFQAERAVSPVDLSTTWVVLDCGFVVHREATDFLRFLDGVSRSPNTIRAYAGRVARFLSWCADGGVDWRTVSLPNLARFKHWLEASPIGGDGRLREGKSVNAVLTAVCEFLRYCARHDHIDRAVADRLSEPRYLFHLPPGFDPGERGQLRTVRARSIRAREVEQFPEALTPDQARRVFECCRTPRERFVVQLLHDSGVRIGEALGLRREDIHPLPDSRCLGCSVVGAHIHVRHRANPNGALAKSRFARVVPVTVDVVAAYGDYRFERSVILGDDDNDMVLVNLYHPPLGAALTYKAAKGFFDRLAHECAFPVRPHMLRHTAATNWVRAGVAIDVVQKLLGHASLASTTVYLHASDDDKRRAVEMVAAVRPGLR